MSAPQKELAGQDDEGALPNGHPAVPLEPSVEVFPPSVSERPVGIQWNLFFRIASPLSALAGFLSLILLPIGPFVLLPFIVVRVIKRYRPHHPGPLQGRHGARLGAFAAMLSFLSFLLFFLAIISVNRPALLGKLQEMAKQATDPQNQQTIYWATTNQGFVAFMGFTLAVILGIFLMIGVASGILAASSKSKTRL